MNQPDVVAKYCKDANSVDNTNHLRQDLLGLERCWVTQDGNFRISTGLGGKTTTDVYQLSIHHGLIINGKTLLNIFKLQYVYNLS